MANSDVYPDYRSIIARWDKQADLARDIDEKPATVRAWKIRNNIRPKYWDGIVLAAEARGFNSITLPVLARIARLTPEKSN